MEKANNYELARYFSDIQINRKDNRLLKLVYRKKTVKGFSFNFQSICSLQRKLILIRILFNREHKICFTELS